MLGNGKGSSWRHCRKGAELRDVTCHATWSCLLSVGNALSTAYLLMMYLVCCNTLRNFFDKNALSKE